MTMNRTVDVVAPSTYVDRTAAGILTGLAGGGWVYSNDLDADIVAAGGRVACKGVAFKALRNMGYPVATEKARHLSRYRLYADSRRWRRGGSGCWRRPTPSSSARAEPWPVPSLPTRPTR